MIMKDIYLKSDKGLWELYSYESLNDINNEINSRGIVINSLAMLSTPVYVGNNVVIGDCKISSNVRIEDNCIIGDNSRLGIKCFLGDNVVLGKGVVLDSDVTIGSNSNLSDDLRIGQYAKISSGVDIQDKFYITGSRNTVSYVGEGKFAIGCISRSIDEWFKDAEATAIKYEYGSQELLEYIRILRYARDYYNKVISIEYLAQENGFAILQENGFKIIL